MGREYVARMTDDKQSGRHADLAAKLNRVTYLLVALVVLELFQIIGTDPLTVSVVGFLGLVAIFVGLVVLGLSRST